MVETRLALVKEKQIAHECTPEVSIIIPANNEEVGIGAVIHRINRVMAGLDHSYEIIVVDDGSLDDTAAEAESAGARVVRHPYNIGNGAAVKTGIRNARGSIMVMLDGDGQHPPEQIPDLLEKLRNHDMVVAARTRDSETSAHRDLANRIYNGFASYVCSRRIEDLTSGFRAIRSNIARQFVSLLPNKFSYPTTITLATVRSGYSLAYVPVQTARRQANSRSKIRLFRDGSRFFLIIFKVTTMFSPMKIFLPFSFFTFLVGVAYGLYRIFALDTRYGPTSAMLITVSILMFLIGLVSEQVAQLRFDRIDVYSQDPESCPPRFGRDLTP
ncbi:MAG: glycosyltransferase family 2 protein [Syntrophobacteraceae bacterium]|nr:glycosyltransferase family 2 protein [Syntrophobacteraceae bacterium]